MTEALHAEADKDFNLDTIILARSEVKTILSGAIVS